MECQYEVVCDLSYVPFPTTLNDPNPDSRSRHYLTLNISETVRDRDIITIEY